MKVVLWDFDGVIADTRKIKKEAFAYAVERDGDAMQKMFVDYHVTAGGINRNKKFDYYLNVINVDSLCSLDDLSARFSSFLRGRLPSLSIVPEVKQAIVYCHKKADYTYVVSAADSEEIKLVLENNSVLDMVDGVYGGEKDKCYHISSLKAEHKSAEFILVGDSEVDSDAARASEIDFIYLKDFSEWDFARDKNPKAIVASSKDIEKKIKDFLEK